MGSHIFLLSLFNFFPAFIYYFMASFLKFYFFISVFFSSFLLSFLFSFDSIFHLIFSWQSYFFLFFILIFLYFYYYLLLTCISFLFYFRPSSESIPVFHLISLFLCLFNINLMSFHDLRSIRSFVHSHLLAFLFLVKYILTVLSSPKSMPISNNNLPFLQSLVNSTKFSETLSH